MNQQTSLQELDYQPPAYKFRTWMNGTIFTMNGKKYKVIKGHWIIQEGKALDSIIFDEIRTDGYPPVRYNIPESIFFDKVTLPTTTIST